jgi:hypothetical protein
MGMETFLPLREEHSLRLFNNKVMRIFANRRDELTIDDIMKVLIG